MVWNSNSDSSLGVVLACNQKRSRYVCVAKWIHAPNSIDLQKQRSRLLHLILQQSASCLIHSELLRVRVDSTYRRLYRLR